MRLYHPWKVFSAQPCLHRPPVPGLAAATETLATWPVDPGHLDTMVSLTLIYLHNFVLYSHVLGLSPSACVVVLGNLLLRRGSWGLRGLLQSGCPGGSLPL